MRSEIKSTSDAEVQPPTMDNSRLITSNSKLPKVEEKVSFPRVIELVPNVEAHGPSTYCTNLVRTSRYTAYNFLPVNLFEQLRELQNFYFLIIGVLQIIPAITTSGGIPNMYIPLCFILFVSGLRAAIEDYQRHQTDKREGSRMYDVFVGSKNGGFVPKQSADLLVGHVVMVKGNQPVPADMLFLRSSHERGHCFVETASLDGETDLKPKLAVAALHAELSTPAKLDTLSGTLRCEGPNKKLDVFKGYLDTTLVADGKMELMTENFVLRGTVIKNTDWIYGLVVFTGDDSKIRQNVKQDKKKIKRSSVMKIVDQGIVRMLILQVILCFIAAVLAGTWYRSNSDMYFLQLDDSAAIEGVVRFFTWFIILSQLVPISLLVSSEIVKTFQAYFINEDLFMYDAATDQPTLVRSNLLNEDLGQVEFIFSDKTGTLTQNRMEFRVAFVGSDPFGSAETEISKRVTSRRELVELQRKGGSVFSIPKRKPYTQLVEELRKKSKLPGTEVVEFDAKDTYLDLLWLGKIEHAEVRHPHTPHYLIPDQKSEAPHLHISSSESELMERRDLMHRYLAHMAISNTITPILDEKTNKYVFQASSPDELALCKFSQFMGFELISRNPTKLAIHKFGRGADVVESYRHLATLGFNSKRKRVTMIYEKDGVVQIMCKGADSNVLPLIKRTPKFEMQQETLMTNLLDMAQNGLRTLVVAFADVDMKWWNEWQPVYERACTMPETGDENKHQKGACTDQCRICKSFNDLELAAEFQLLGATAIEDRLQDLVPECIEDYLMAGVKVWMLTGDKRETAKNIGMACNLIDPDMENADDWTQSRLIEVTGQWAEILEDREELKALFQSFDLNGDGFIDDEELQFCLAALPLPIFSSVISTNTSPQSPAAESTSLTESTRLQQKKEIDKLFRYADQNHDGKIDFEEFVEMMRSINLSTTEAVHADIQQGLELIKRWDLKKDPVSMVVEGNAFSVLYPASETDKSKKKRRIFKKTKQTETTTDEKVPGRLPALFSNERLDKLRDDFFSLAVQMKSVICCRLTPFQKAKIVQEIKKRQGVITLAIGDGANDEAMILEADVGVGISGLEGTAASRASSYAIGQFRFLHTLLFVHGHWSYRRIAKLVLYIFYKAIMVVIVMFWFGFFSLMSGQQLFNDFVYLFYNVLFTAAPILVLAVFDRSLGRQTLENSPLAYGAILRGHYFNKVKFYSWVFRSFWHALIIYFFVHGALGIQDAAHRDGQTHDVNLFATVGFSCVVLIATFRIVLEYVSITALHQFFVWISFFGYFFVLWLITLPSTYNADMYGVVPRMYAMPSAWLTMFLTVCVPILIDFTYEAYMREFHPSLPQVLQERERLSEAEIIALPPATIKPVIKRKTTPVAVPQVVVDVELQRRTPKGKLDTTARKHVLMQHVLRRYNPTRSSLIQNSETSQFLALDK